MLVNDSIKYDLIRNFCIEFIDSMFKDKGLTDFTKLTSPHNLEKNGEVILKYFLK